MKNENLYLGLGALALIGLGAYALSDKKPKTASKPETIPPVPTTSENTKTETTAGATGAIGQRRGYIETGVDGAVTDNSKVLFYGAAPQHYGADASSFYYPAKATLDGGFYGFFGKRAVKKVSTERKWVEPNKSSGGTLSCPRGYSLVTDKDGTFCKQNESAARTGDTFNKGYGGTMKQCPAGQHAVDNKDGTYTCVTNSARIKIGTKDVIAGEICEWDGSNWVNCKSIKASSNA